MDINSSVTHQNQPKLFRQKGHGLVQLLMQSIELSRLHARSQAPFNDIIIWSIFFSVNAIQKFLSHELIPVIHGYDQCMSKDIYQDCRNKGFMFIIREVWDRVYSPEKQFFNIKSRKWPSTSSLKSFSWF